MNREEVELVVVAGSITVGYLFGAQHPINGMDDLKSEVCRLREQLHLQQVYAFVESRLGNVVSLADRRAAKSRKSAPANVWQGQAERTLEEEAKRDAAA